MVGSISDRRLALALLCLSVVLAGCAGGGVLEPPTPTRTPPPRVGGDYERSSYSPLTRTPGADGVTVQVEKVVDGDTVVVQYANGTNSTVELAGIDAPEPRPEAITGEYPRVPETNLGRRCLAERGIDAREALAGMIATEEVTLYVDSAGEPRTPYGRLRVHLYTNGTNLNHYLVAHGYGSAVNEPAMFLNMYREAEAAANDAALGVWRCKYVDDNILA
jgi:micrococcal nuclease